MRFLVEKKQKKNSLGYFQRVGNTNVEQGVNFFNHATTINNQNSSSLSEGITYTGDALSYIEQYMKYCDFYADKISKSDLFVITPSKIKLRISKAKDDTIYVERATMFSGSYPYEATLRNINDVNRWIVDIVAEENDI